MKEIRTSTLSKDLAGLRDKISIALVEGPGETPDLNHEVIVILKTPFGDEFRQGFTCKEVVEVRNMFNRALEKIVKSKRP